KEKSCWSWRGAVEFRGVPLPAGSYTFELADPNASRHIIRVSEKESGKHLGLFMTIPNTRLDPPSDNLIMFAERPAGLPPAIQVWFYPGERTGEEFVYPKAQAIQIAKANKKGVLATEGGGVTTTASEESRIASMRSASVGRVDERGTMTEENKASNTPTTTTAPSTTTARAEAPTAGTSGKAAAPARRRALPRTASNLVALELLSALSLLGAVG